MEAKEIIGTALGWALAPGAAALTALRRARLLHPDGVVYRAEVTPLVNMGPATAVADRLRGPAIVRLSASLWKGRKEWIDTLGIAVRFRRDPAVSVEAAPDDQDLLMTTIRWPWTLPFAPLTTDTHSFLWNDYHGISPFWIPELGRVKLRLVSPHRRAEAKNRLEDLQIAVEHGLAVFELQARKLERGARFEPIAAVRLLERLDIDQEALRFWPFREGRSLAPRGFVHALRRGAYVASQWVRPKTARAR